MTNTKGFLDDGGLGGLTLQVHGLAKLFHNSTVPHPTHIEEGTRAYSKTQTKR